MKTIGLLLGSSLLAIVIASPSLAAKVALVIGNADYSASPTLGNPVRDALVVAETFEKLGFETIFAENLTQREFADVLLKFEGALAGAEVAAFYYAGHGIQYDGRSYLVSVDAELDNPFMVQSETMPLDLIIHTMESKAALNILFIDACRRNQFAGRLSRGPTPVAEGLAPAADVGADTLVMYATGYNSVAFDGTADNSPFAASLAQHLPAPDTEVGTAMKRVIRDVRAATGGVQSPEMLTTIADELYLNESPEVEQTGLAEVEQLLPPGAAPADARRRLEQLFDEGEQHRLANRPADYLVALLHARNLAAWYFGENSMEYGQASNRLVGALTSMGRLDDAIYASSEAIRVFTLIEGERSTSVLNEKINLAGRLHLAGRDDQAEALFLEIIATFEDGRYSPQDEVFHAFALEAYSSFLADFDRDAEALEVSTRAIELDVALERRSREIYGHVLLNHARRLDKAGRCAEAAPFAAQALKVYLDLGFAESMTEIADSRALAAGC